MAIDLLYLLYGAFFIASVLLVEGVSLILRDRRLSGGRVNRRLRMLARGADGREVLEQLRRNTVAYDGPGRRLLGFLARRLTRAGIAQSADRAALVMAGLAAAGAVFPMVFRTALPEDLPLAITCAAGAVAFGWLVPMAVLSSLYGRRVAAFTRQLPDALDIMVRSLEAGHPVPAAMSLVSREMEDPIGTEFGIAVDEMTYGLDLQDALRNLAVRVEIPEFQYVVVAIGIQSETGGNLSEVLRSLSSVIRDRQRMFLKVRALSGEGRASAKILTALPILTCSTLFATNSDFYLGVVDDPLFMPVAAYVSLQMLFGIWLIRRMVNFKV